MNKKSIIGALGIAGLTLIGGLALTNQTYAQETTSSEVTVQVKVLPNGQSVAIKSPTSDSKVLENQVPLNIDFTKSKTIEYEIKLTDKDGTTTTIANETVDVSNAGAANSGSKKIPLDMQQLTNGVFGKVSIKVTVDGKAETADTVEFNYVPVDVEKTQVNSNGYTGFRITHAAGVAKVKVTLKDKSGHKIGDKEIKNILELRRELYAYNVGDKVELTVLREGKETKVQVTLGAQPEQQSNNNLQQYQQGQQGQGQEQENGQEGQTPRLPFPGQR